MEGVSSRPPPHTSYFWNSRIREYSRTAGISSKGGFIPLGETVCRLEAESLWRRVTVWRIPAVLPIPEIWSISESNFKMEGVSLISRKMKLPISEFQNFKLREGVSSRILPLFLEFQIFRLFQNRGNFNWREFHNSPSNCLFSRSWVGFTESNQTETSPRLSDSKSFHYFQRGSFIQLQKLPPFLEFQIFRLFHNRGNFKVREFQTSPSNSLFPRR